MSSMASAVVRWETPIAKTWSDKTSSSPPFDVGFVVPVAPYLNLPRKPWVVVDDVFRDQGFTLTGRESHLVNGDPVTNGACGSRVK